MSDFEPPRQEGFVQATKDLLLSPVVGEELCEVRTAGDLAADVHHSSSLFGSRAAGDAMAGLGRTAPVKLVGDALAPLSLAASAGEMYHGLAHGQWGETLHGGAGAFAAGIGSVGAAGDAASWLGTALHGTSIGARLAGTGESLVTSVGTKSLLGPAGALVGSGLAGWDIGNEFNAITRERGDYGQNSDGTNRSFSDKAGDDGWAVHEAVARYLGGERYGGVADALGHVAGGATVLGESMLGTVAAAPTVVGHELAAAGAAINHGAARLFDWICK
jgi:hypothetical protein